MKKNKELLLLAETLMLMSDKLSEISVKIYELIWLENN